MKKIFLLITILSSVFNYAQRLEYNAHMSLKYNNDKASWENNNTEANYKTSVDIDDFNRLINVNYIGVAEMATLNLSVSEKVTTENGSITYVCKGTKSSILDKIVIGFNQPKTEMTIMFKCKENGTCETATFHSNK